MNATFLPLGIVTALGAITGIYFPVSTIPAWLLAIVLVILSLGTWYFLRSWHFVSQYLLYVAFGCVWCAFVSIHTVRPLPITHPIPLYSDCEVLAEPLQSNSSFAFPVMLQIANAPYTALAFTHRYPGKLISGDHVRIIGELKPFTQSPADNRNSLLLRSAISGTQATLTIHSLVSIRNDAPAWKRTLIRLRNRIDDWIRDVIYTRMSGEGAVLCESLLLGNYQQLGTDTVAEFRRTGLVHLLALSGLQMIMIWGIIEGIASILRIPYKTRLAFILIGLLFYRFLLPTIASVDRALIMALWFVGARIRGVKLNGWQAWGGALFSQSLIMPETVVTPGFQLSFGAVAGLLLVAPIRVRLFQSKEPVHQFYQKSIQWLGTGLITSLAAIVASAPFLIFHFGYISYVGLLLNLPAIPLSAAILYGTILLCFFSWFVPVAQCIATGTERCGDLLIWLAHFPGSMWGPGSSAFSSALLFAIGFFLLVATIQRNRKRQRFFAYSIVVLSVIVYGLTRTTTTLEQQRLLTETYTDHDRCIYVAESTHAASDFARSWLREFGNRPISILVLHSDSLTAIPTTETLKFIHAGGIEPGKFIALSERVVWHSIAVDYGEDTQTGWGVLTDSAGAHHAYITHLAPKELERLGWTWQLPTGKRMPILANSLPASALWLVNRWNNPN